MMNIRISTAPRILTCNVGMISLTIAARKQDRKVETWSDRRTPQRQSHWTPVQARICEVGLRIGYTYNYIYIYIHNQEQYRITGVVHSCADDL